MRRMIVKTSRNGNALTLSIPFPIRQQLEIVRGDQWNVSVVGRSVVYTKMSDLADRRVLDDVNALASVNAGKGR
jgi:antitoxin component of MazEF toxin-antitoxin module